MTTVNNSSNHNHHIIISSNSSRGAPIIDRPIIGQFADNWYRSFDNRHRPIFCKLSQIKIVKLNYLFYIAR